jgi:hypothetical protein
MKCTGPFLFLLVFGFLCPVSQAQQPTMSASTGLGPGNSFTLFITFQKPMPKVIRIQCEFRLQGDAKPGQDDFSRQLQCNGAATKDDDTHYHVTVGEIPTNIAAGDYKIVWINVAVDADVTHQYRDAALPALPPVTVSNPRQSKFSPIEKLDTKP